MIQGAFQLEKKSLRQVIPCQHCKEEIKKQHLEGSIPYPDFKETFGSFKLMSQFNPETQEGHS